MPTNGSALPSFPLLGAEGAAGAKKIIILSPELCIPITISPDFQFLNYLPCLD